MSNMNTFLHSLFPVNCSYKTIRVAIFMIFLWFKVKLTCIFIFQMNYCCNINAHFECIHKDKKENHVVGLLSDEQIFPRYLITINVSHFRMTGLKKDPFTFSCKVDVMLQKHAIPSLPIF